ncbi:MAG: hypothetical protein R2693_10085 [Nocardioidaceae bacterium]
MRHWHVTLTLSGEPVELAFARAAVRRLADQQPFLDSVQTTEDTAEIQYWDEGTSMLDVASLALRFWNEYRQGAKLPKWEVVGLEVVGQDLWSARTGNGQSSMQSSGYASPDNLALLSEDFAQIASEGEAARVALATRAARDSALEAMAAALHADADQILAANSGDIAAAEAEQTRRLRSIVLRLDDARLEGMALGLEDVAGLPDPVGGSLRGSTLANGLQMRQIRVPFRSWGSSTKLVECHRRCGRHLSEKSTDNAAHTAWILKRATLQSSHHPAR